MLEVLSSLIPQFAVDLWNGWPPGIQYLLTTLFKILILAIGVILCVAFSTYFERKVIGSMQARVGPNRVGPKGLLQPFADVIKLLIKEVVVPSQSNKFLYVIAPLLSLTPALAAWAVIPMNDWFVIADINAGLLYVLALTSVGVYGVILAGWATNSKYAFLGAMRSAAHGVDDASALERRLMESEADSNHHGVQGFHRPGCDLRHRFGGRRGDRIRGRVD